MTNARILRLILLPALAAFCLFLGVRSAEADGIDYVATSTYTSSTSTSAYSTPNKTFTFTFSEPQTLSSLSTSVPITLNLGSGSCCAYSGLGEIIFYPASQLGLFDIDFTAGGDTFTWEFFGPQLYSGSGPYTLSSAAFPVDGLGSTTSEFYDSKGLYSGTFNAGTVSTVKTSEPSSVLLLGCGLFALVLFARRRRQPVAVKA